VAIDKVGDHVAVGAPCDYTTGSTQCGFVYVWVIPGAHWIDSTHENAVLQHLLPTQLTEPTLGFSVAMDPEGLTIITGAPGLTNAKGAVDLFAQPPGGWVDTSTPGAVLVPPDAGAGDRFGFSVAMNSAGNSIAAGAPNHCPLSPCSPTGPGAAYVFSNTNGWLQQAELSASDGNPGDTIGWSVSLSDEAEVVVGAPHFENTATPGAVYVFVWPASQNELQKLAAISGTDINNNAVVPGSLFGLSVSRGASVLAVGGTGTVAGKPDVSTAFVF